MYLAQVVGTVVATRKDDRLVGMKLLLVRPLDPQEHATDNTRVAVDAVGAGVGEKVLVTTGSSARVAVKDYTDSDQSPADETIVGIVDVVEVGIADS